jgi:hypothetical protein
MGPILVETKPSAAPKGILLKNTSELYGTKTKMQALDKAMGKMLLKEVFAPKQPVRSLSTMNRSSKPNLADHATKKLPVKHHEEGNRR